MLGSILEAGNDIADNLGDLLNVGKYIVYAVAGIAVIGTGILVFQIVKNPIKSAQAAAAFTPAGGVAAAAQSLKK